MAVVVVTVRKDYTCVVVGGPVGGPDGFAEHYVEPLYEPGPKTVIDFLVETREMEQSVNDMQGNLIEYAKQAKVIARNTGIERRHHRLVELAGVGLFATVITVIAVAGRAYTQWVDAVILGGVWTFFGHRLHLYIEDRWPNGPWR